MGEILRYLPEKTTFRLPLKLSLYCMCRSRRKFASP